MSFDPRFTRRDALSLMAAAGAAAALPGAALAQEGGLLQGAQVMGDPDAPVTIIEYVSLTCPHCARFHTHVFPEIKKDYIETGKAKLEYREVYFDRLGLWGGMVARCGGADKYFAYIDHMLRTQREWTRQEDVLDTFKKIGRVGGLSSEQVEACLNDQESAKALVEQYQEYRKDPRLTGTPTLIVGDEKIENPTYENLAAAIDALL
ncbi:DsbA family protein [Rhodovulum sp. DZ06]|uniref:DsbA family protein n=1 Tax=Rhodovulum sp. DZ06 TaxID=3425126 RepID=UPI003D34AD16